MKRLLHILLLVCLACPVGMGAEVPASRMRQVYDEVRTPYKYGLVLAPQDNKHKIDCPAGGMKRGWPPATICSNGGAWVRYCPLDKMSGMPTSAADTWA
jgi:hypothetical protein